MQITIKDVTREVIIEIHISPQSQENSCCLLFELTLLLNYKTEGRSVTEGLPQDVDSLWNDKVI